MAETSDRPPRVGVPAIDLIIAVCVVLISVASLWVAVRSGQIQERTLAASVWPYLEVGTSDVTDSGTHIILYTVENKGVGPALLKWFTISYGGRAFGDPRELLKACCGFTGNAITSTIHDRVIAARESIDFVKVLPGHMTPAEYARLDQANGKLGVHACYCSVLDDCWMLEPPKEQPTPVRACPPSPVQRDVF
jgi:hypothetical protein